MMCSSWKFSIFGILALMLAFGMTADDAMAQDSYGPVGIAVAGADTLRAAGTIATATPITFTVSTSSTATTKDGTITITVPAGWSRPFLTTDTTDDRPGAVTVVITAGTEGAAPTAAVRNNQLILNVKKGVEGASAVWSYRNAKLPARAGIYTFNVSSAVHGDITRLDPALLTGTLDRAKTDEGNGRYIALNVGSVASGTGDFKLTSPSFTKGNDKNKVAVAGSDPVTYHYNYEKHNLVYAEQALGNLVFTFTATGTMYKNSVITLYLPGNTTVTTADTTPTWATDQPLRSDNGDGVADRNEFTVSGANYVAASSDQTTLVATLGATVEAGHRVVFTIKNPKAPKVEGVDVTAEFVLQTASIEASDGSGSPETPGKVSDSVFFSVHSKHGTGKVTVDNTNRRGDAAANLVFTFTPEGTMLGGSVVEIAVPTGWMPSPYVSNIGGVTDPAGHVRISSAARTPADTVTVDNRKIILTLGDDVAKHADAASTTIAITYFGAKAPKEQGNYPFPSKASSHKQGTPASIGSPTINVITGHGSGTIVLMRGDSTFTQATKNTDVGTLTFVYTSDGIMPEGSKIRIDWPHEWSPPRADNADGRYDAGEMIVTPADKASLVLARNTATDNTDTPGIDETTRHKATITTKALEKRESITLTYRNVKVPNLGPRSDTFHTRVLSGPFTETGTVTTEAIAFNQPGARLDSSPVVGIGQVPDGSGTIVASIDSADAGSMVDMIDFTYTAAGSMTVDSQVDITVPEGWSPPTLENNDGTVDAGESSVSGAGAPELSVVSGNMLTVTLGSPLSKDETFKVTYKKATVPSTGGSYRFATRSKVTLGGTPTALAQSPSITVSQVASGSITLTSADGALTSAAPNMGLGKLMFTFTAGAQMQIGAQVMITVPLGWTAPFIDNNDGVDAAGEVSLAGMADLSVSGGGAQPWILTATTKDAVLEVGNTLTFTYKMVTAPAAEATYTFTTNASISPGATALPLSSQPSVIVRAPVAAIAVSAMPTSVFIGDDITVTVNLQDADGEPAKALGDMEVMLSSSSESGSFTDDDGNAITSVTIADNMGSASATYGDSTAGMATITATSDELTDMVDVEIKSTIRDLVVDNKVVKSGSTVMVSATGKAGGGTVTILDAEGGKVGTKKALDPVGDPDDDGDQEYERSVTLPETLIDRAMYTLSVEIQGATDNSLIIQVLNDQSAPTLSDASALPVQASYAMNGSQVVLSVTVEMNDSDIPIAKVVADTSELDSGNPEIELDRSDDGVYNKIFTVSMDNTNDDGEKMVSFTATDDLDNVSEAMSASITLKNDTEAPTLSMASAMPSPANDRTEITISVMSESGLTVTADATSIGGGMVTLTEGTMAADDSGGMDAAADSGGMDAADDSSDMDAGAMPAGNGMYSGMATVTGADDGEQTITITGTDASGNKGTAMVSVMIDNTGPMLSDAMADPAMAMDGTMVTISVSTESGATVMADASAIGGDAATALAEGMDDDMMGTGMYSAMVTVAEGTTDGDHMVSITATDALGNEGDAASVTVTVDNTAPALSDAAITPDWAKNGGMVTISVMTESGATVTANASAIGGAADLALAEGMDDDMMGTGMYSAEVTVTDAEGGDQMVSITASDALGNMSEAVTASVSIHAVTSASFSPADVSTGDMVMVSAMGTAGLTATFSVFDADGNNIVTDGSLTEDAETPGSYSGSFEVVIDAHPTGTYWVSATIGQASMTAEGALTIDHLAQFTLSIGAGTHLIHVPLDVTHIDGVAATIDTVGDLYDALGDSVNFIISLGADGTWNSYLGDSSAGGAADAAIGDDTGLIAVMSSAASITLAGNALGTGGASAINLAAGNNLVGVPLDPAAGLDMISDAVAHPAVSAIVVSNAAGNGFNTIAQAGDPGDGPVMGGVGYIVVASAAASIPVIGMAWDNSMADDMGDGMTASNGMNGAATAPSIGFQTPVLQVQGKLIDEAGMILGDGLNVSVRNVTRGTTLGSTTAADDYSMTFVKLDTSAAKVGDVLEIRADSSNPLIGVRPVQHVVTAADVLDSRISLPDLVTYEIPAQTELLANYPNPFNPETWIPFRLAEDSNVSLSIYGASGSLVRTIDIGFTPAAVYEGRSDAIYWDGRNDFGEQVSSGIYFYHLSAGEFSATRKMVIVK